MEEDLRRIEQERQEENRRNPLPGPTSTGPDYGKKSCAEGGCTVWGPCPDGPDRPPVSHWICTDAAPPATVNEKEERRYQEAKRACERYSNLTDVGKDGLSATWKRCMREHGIVGG